MDRKEIFLSYNLDAILNIYEKIKEKSIYTGIMDMITKSSEFINVILSSLELYDVPSEEGLHVNTNGNDQYNDVEYYNYEA
jgi:hypothetical protein